MSFFGVTVHTIEEIYPHSNADKLELGKVSGLNFQFVMAKDNYAVGDKVLYFPIDSLIPTVLAEKMGLVGFNPKQETHRIKTVTLRGEISQGFVCPPREEYINLTIFNRGDTEEITKHLGVIKYEPEEKICQDGILRELPTGLGAYDINGAERNMDIINSLMNKPVQITEKLEGSNFSVCSYVGGRITVNTRNNTIEEITNIKIPRTPESMAKGIVSILYNMDIIDKPSRDNPTAGEFGKLLAEKFTEKIVKDLTPKKNIYWEVARREKIIEFAKYLTEVYNLPIVVYGELIGPSIQKNYYNLKEVTVRIFDIKIGMDESATCWTWLSDFDIMTEVMRFFGNNDILVPVLFIGILSDFLNDTDIVTASTGKSVLNDKKLREGIVIKADTSKRTIIKQRDPIYLAKSGN